MKRFCIAVVNVVLCSACMALGEPPVMVKKVTEAFDGPVWLMSPWNTGGGQLRLSDDAAPGSDSKKCMEFEARFSGKGFEGITAVPRQRLIVPGDIKTLTVRAKRSDLRYGLKIGFKDGWGRDKANNQELEWWLPFDAGSKDWQTFTFKIPDDWVRPVAIDAVLTHNWMTKGIENTATFWIDQLEVETDIANVDQATGALKTWTPDPKPADPANAIKEVIKTPLLTVGFTTSAESNVFAGEEPNLNIQVLNWKAGTLTGKATCVVVDSNNNVVETNELNLSVDSSTTSTLPLAVPAFGRYRARASLELSDGSKHAQQLVFAKLPAPKALTEEQKMASPYGLNIHSAVRSVLTPFRKAGVVWYREYSFQFDWLVRAKGDDRRYAGWPYYPKMLKAYAEADAMVVPVLQQGSMKAPVIKDGKAIGTYGPDREWQKEMAGILLAFPQFKYWELNNEYDLSHDNFKAEEAVGWANYAAYHKQFGELVSSLGMGDLTAVENGRPEIQVDITRKLIQSGAFDKIGVVNYHYYCGPDSPELNFENYNIGIDPSSEQFGSLYDRQRAIKKAANIDGKKRQTWLTEFGWDTLAGPVVSPYEQAVYLQRGWMLTMAAGTDKAFWYWNQYDAVNAQSFFGGCGMLDPKGEPKLSLSAMAGLTSILPAPRYVGSLNAGDNTWGYVFENEGKLVAALWTVVGDNGPTVNFNAEQLYDFLGNKLPGKSSKLTMAPTYAVGLDRSDPLYRQTAYSLASKHLMVATAGDSAHATVTISNNRQEPINCKVSLALPETWVSKKPETAASIAPGATQDIELPFSVANMESQGLRNLKVVITEDEVVREIPFRLLVLPAVTLEVGPLAGRPGPASCVIKVKNLSSQIQNPTLKISVPDTWHVATSTVPVPNLQPQETREVKLDLTWSADWKPDQNASVQLSVPGGTAQALPLIPSQYRLHAAESIKLDGDISDWPAKTELPNWMLGSTAGPTQAKLYLSWAKEGLYGAVVVHDSKVNTKSPVTFWAGDALELFIDTRDDKRHRSYEPGDHQFWLMPQIEENRVYVGQWKNGSELEKTLFDLKNIRSAAKKTPDGYVMEFLLPADAMKQYQPVAGGKIGLNLVLTVQGQKLKREVFWPRAKTTGVPWHPDWWGTLELAK